MTGINLTGFYTVGGGDPPIDFTPNLFQHATTSQLQSFGDSEATRSHLREPKGPGGAYPSKSSVLRMIDYFASLTKDPV